MTKRALIFGLLCCFAVNEIKAQSAPEVLQTCSFEQSLKATDLPVYKTICSEDDQHSIKIEVSGKSASLLKIYDGDNANASPFVRREGIKTFTSSRLCLTLQVEDPSNFISVDLKAECVPVDRTKWPLQQAIGK